VGIEINEKALLDYVTAVGALTEKVATSNAAQTNQDAVKRAAIEDAIPEVIAALVANDRIGDGEREKMARVLRDPEKTLRFIEKLAGHRSTTELHGIGTPLPAEKQASVAYNSLNSPFVGVATSQTRESDRRFLSGLGLTQG
jgi:hypothetical protein